MILRARQKPISIKQLAARFQSTGEDSSDFSLEVEKIFFASLRLPNGTFKLTYPHRLDDVNACVQSLLPRGRALAIMDVGISSGVSTLEWIESLEQCGIDFHMTASDLSTSGFVISVTDHIHFLVDSNGYPLLFELGNEWITNQASWRYLVRYLWARLAFAATRAWVGSAVLQGRAAHRRIESQPMPLVIPQLWRNPKVTIVQDDLLANTTYPKRFDVIRVANVLNLDYFDNDEISRMLITLRRSMKTGGLAVVCRTDKHERNNATVFSLDKDGRFQRAARLRTGSEVEDLILALSPARNSADQP